MQIGRLPFSYLGVPLFREKPKKSMLQPIADKILSKFASLLIRRKALSLAGRTTLIKSVITRSFVHSFMIYKWPSSLLRLVNRSSEETKLIRVAWGRCCKPYSQGGLGLKDLGLLNDSLLKKLTWKFMTSKSFAFSFLREQYLTQLQKSHGGYVTSSIWPSFHSHYSDLLKKGIWLVRENSQRDFWRDNWLGVPILELVRIPDYLATLLKEMVSDFIYEVTDSLVWANSRDGQVSCKSAYSCVIHDSPAGFHLASRCSVCRVSSESSDHLFIRCPLAVALWEAIFSAFQRRISADTWSSFFFQAMSVSFSNQWIFESKTMDFRSVLSFVWHAVSDANRLEIGCIRNFVDDLLILPCFDLRGRPARAPIIRSVIWSPPAPHWTKVNIDGAALNSQGAGGCGDIFRNCRAFVKGCFAVPLDHVFAFEAELLAASIAINFSWQNGWHRIWLESDSSYVVQFLSSRSEQENQVADALSKHALGLEVDSWWANSPSFCSLLVDNDCMGRESFRFS
ncbi:hypothetical protein Ddye_012227 [Dipteronia dyeriana]|uniref:RNase H type-1 domain-containing protein n=1 Tax=Dipteronia dyeriana TaxID=168575 RepID=A0AAD9X438_9ROSI|nr:hypothetical protein Ddye_012227 [Dipteronia dyeriana]